MMDVTMYEHIYTVDLNQPLKRHNVGLLATYDKKANRFGAKITRNGAEVDVSNYAAKAYFIRPSGDTIEFDGTAAGNLAFADLPEECYLYDGAFTVTIKIESDELTATVLICDGKMVQTRTSASAPGDGDTPIDVSVFGDGFIVDGNTVSVDQEAIVQQVITALGTPVFGTVDEENNIILTGELAAGTYTLKYENADGTTTVIGTLTSDGTDDGSSGEGSSGEFDVPITWIIGTKLSKTDGSVEATDATDYNASDFITLVDGASYVIATTNDCYNTMNVIYYDDNNAFVGYQADLWTSNLCEPEEGQPQSAALTIPDGATKIRLRHYESANNHGWSTELITLTGTLE